MFDESQVLAWQDELETGDEVWLISCRPFLEGTDLTLAARVTANLRRGLTYKYFFPAATSSPNATEHHQPPKPFGREARDSFLAFRSTLDATDLGLAARCYSFEVTAREFGYFSKLHSLVYYKRALPTSRKSSAVFIYVETETGEGKTADIQKKWCRVSRLAIPQLLAELEHARSPVADLGLLYQSLNKKLTTISQEYLKAFLTDEMIGLYDNVRALASNADDCVAAIRAVWVEKRPSAIPDMPRKYLDIGCGNGEITAKIVQALKDVGDADVHITLVEPSPIESERAHKHLAPTTSNLRISRSRFEDCDVQGEFDLITAVHSFYTIDEAYLRRVYELLAPGGIAAIWIGALEENVVNGICAKLDELLQRGRRNYAEDILAALQHMGVTKTTCGMRSETYGSELTSLVDANGSLNDSGQLIANFFCGKKPAKPETVYAAAEQVAVATRTHATREQFPDARHPVTDYLISFHRIPR